MTKINNDNEVMDKVVVYARKSSEDSTRQVASISDQLHDTDKLIIANNYKLVHEPFTEEKSGKVSGVRTEFYKMLDFIEKGGANILVTWHANRLARNGTDGGRIIELVDNGIISKIVTPTSVYDRNNSFMLWVEFMASTKSSKDLSDVVKRRLRIKAEMGIRPGQVPVGYLNTPEMLKGQRQILIDPLRFPLMQKWWTLVLAGVSIKASLDIMTTKGFRDRVGRKIGYSRAANIFRNIFYCGIFDYGGIRYKGTYKPVVTLDEFMRVQRILDGKGGGGRKNIKLPFQGMMKCGECGSTITGESHRRGHKVFWYYRCKKNHGKCKQVYLNADDINPQIRKYLKSMEVHPLFAEWYKNILHRRNAVEFEASKKELELQTKTLNDIEDKKEVLCKMRIDGLITEEKYQEKAKGLLTDEQLILENKPTNKTDFWMKVVSLALNFAENMSKLYEKDDVYVKQMVLKILGSNIFIYNKNVDIKTKSIFIGIKHDEKEYFVKNLSVEQQKTPNLWLNKVNRDPQLALCAGSQSRTEI